MAVLQALAVGDSFGKTTEFATRADIQHSFAEITWLLPPEKALAHQDMRYAQVTDDTEQNFCLIEDYCAAEKITPEVAARSILRWYQEAPEAEKYIGPSSRKAIYALRDGAAVETAGLSGTSCGGIMRAPAAFLCSRTKKELEENVFATLCPTHNTPAAMEAAMGYAFALWAAQKGETISEILRQAKQGCVCGRARYGTGEASGCQPSCDKRLEYLEKVLPGFDSDAQLLNFLFYIYGTTISSCDVFSASLALFMRAQKDVYRAVRMAAMVGGDTDTIGCLAAVLCCVYAGGHNLPPKLVQEVETGNPFSIKKLTEMLAVHSTSI